MSSTSCSAQCGNALQMYINFCLEFTRFINMGVEEGLSLFFNFFHFSYLGETAGASLAIPLLLLSCSTGSSISRTKTKCSMGYNSVRLVLVQDCRLYTSISLWCHCGIVHWYTLTHQGQTPMSYMAMVSHKPPWCLCHRQKIRVRCNFAIAKDKAWN